MLEGRLLLLYVPCKYEKIFSLQTDLTDLRKNNSFMKYFHLKVSD